MDAGLCWGFYGCWQHDLEGCTGMELLRLWCSSSFGYGSRPTNAAVWFVHCQHGVSMGSGYKYVIQTIKDHKIKFQKGNYVDPVECLKLKA